MPAERDDWIRIDDMKDACRRIIRYTTGVTQIAFLEDEMRVDAILRNIGVLGDAANKLTPKFRGDHPSIPWRAIIGMRNRVVHEYGRVDLEAVWQTTQDDIPGLLAQLEALPEPPA
jgi:uncharacterized protein with HEPN domain